MPLLERLLTERLLKMAPDQLQLHRRIHHEVGHLPASSDVVLKAGDVIKLLNVVLMEERRADKAEQSLKKVLTKAAEENLEELLISEKHAGEAGAAAAGRPRPNCVHSAECDSP